MLTFSNLFVSVSSVQSCILSHFTAASYPTLLLHLIPLYCCILSHFTAASYPTLLLHLIPLYCCIVSHFTAASYPTLLLHLIPLYCCILSHCTAASHCKHFGSYNCKLKLSLALRMCVYCSSLFQRAFVNAMKNQPV